MAKILIVDDAEFVRKKVAKILLENGHFVVEADNGKDALIKYQEESPDLVFMDITMPEMDGVECVKELKKIDSNVKIVMLSAMGRQQIVIESIMAGAKDFILKPFQPEKVISVVNKLLDPQDER